MIEVITKSSEETQSMAAAVSGLVRQRDLVLLSGDLGSGKTTFTKGFGAGLGVKDNITSPTFVLLRTYDAAIPLHHADVYRMERLQEVIDLGLMELLDESGVALIEWGDMAAPALPRDYLDVRIGFDADDDHRRFRFETVGSTWSARERAIAEALNPWVAGEGSGSPS